MVKTTYLEGFISRQFFDNAGMTCMRSLSSLEEKPPMVASSTNKTLMDEMAELAMSSMKSAKRTGGMPVSDVISSLPRITLLLLARLVKMWCLTSRESVEVLADDNVGR